MSFTPSQKNQDALAALSEKVKRAKSIVVADYTGTTVAEQVKLRATVQEAGGEFVVTKNTLLDLAMGKGKLSDSLKGMNAAIIAYDDPIAPLKAAFEFHKKSEKLDIKQGYMDERVLTPAEVKELSKLPGKTELLAKLLMILKSPATNMVNVLNAGPRNLVYAVNAIANKK